MSKKHGPLSTLVGEMYVKEAEQVRSLVLDDHSDFIRGFDFTVYPTYEIEDSEMTPVASMTGGILLASAAEDAGFDPWEVADADSGDWEAVAALVLDLDSSLPREELGLEGPGDIVYIDDIQVNPAYDPAVVVPYLVEYLVVMRAADTAVIVYYLGDEELPGLEDILLASGFTHCPPMSNKDLERRRSRYMLRDPRLKGPELPAIDK